MIENDRKRLYFGPGLPSSNQEKMMTPNLIDRFIKACDPQCTLIIDTDLRGRPSRLLLDYIASIGSDIPVHTPIIWRPEELPRQGFVLVHENSDEAKWHCGSWIDVKAYQEDVIILYITFLTAAIRHSYETLVLERKDGRYTFSSPPSARQLSASSPGLRSILQSSTFNMFLSAEQAQQRQQVELPHFAVQKGDEILPLYDFHDSDEDE